MTVPLDEVRKLPRTELIELVAELWEARPGWRTIIVEPGDEIELEIEGDSLDIAVPSLENPHNPEVEMSLDILAVQETPYIELEFINVCQNSEGDEFELGYLNELRSATTGYKVRKSVIVTTGEGQKMTVDKQLYHGQKLVKGEELCELIDQYTEYGFDSKKYL